MVIKCSDENLRGMVRDVMSLRDDINDVSCYAGYYIIAENDENAREIMVAINKWSENDPIVIGKVHRWFEIQVVCEDPEAFECIWTDWDGTETQDSEELFEQLKEIRDNITEESFYNYGSYEN